MCPPHTPLDPTRLYSVCYVCGAVMSRASKDGFGVSPRGWRKTNSARARIMAGADFRTFIRRESEAFTGRALLDCE